MPILLGITGYSGSGKTTLLEKLIPELHQLGLKIGVIKHSHHQASVDHQGKDSFRMREAGATQVALATDERWAIMTETTQPISLLALAEKFDNDHHLILVEGFKQEPIPKILLHRQAMTKPLPIPDSHTLALATDTDIDYQDICCLNINNPKQIALFIYHWWKKQS